MDDRTATPGPFIVSDDHAGWRLDRFLADVAPGISRSLAQRMIAVGHVTVNGRAAKPSTTLASGDAVALASDALPSPADALPVPEAIPLAIVYEDDHLIVIDKPAGLVVHPAPGHSGGTLVNALLAHTAQLGNAASARPGIVHRLDKDTSGLLLVAKDDATLAALGAAMRRHAITKEYQALVEGHMRPPSGAIEAPIGRDPRLRQRMAVLAQGGREARTLYATERIIGGRSLVRATLVTGRTHQIRVHFAAVEHPVVGDPVYGRAQPPQPPRIFLHAAHLALAHPITGAALDFISPLPPDLAAFLAKTADD
jgi:23S rRNA pseudouridine1911/1915/1917 synthase